jgi:hypothetical protein
VIPAERFEELVVEADASAELLRTFFRERR